MSPTVYASTCRMMTDTDIAILRFVERSQHPLSWYNARYLDVGVYGTPVAALHALYEQSSVCR